MKLRLWRLYRSIVLRFGGLIRRPIEALVERDVDLVDGVAVWAVGRARSKVVVSVTSRDRAAIGLTVTAADGTVRRFGFGPADRYEIRVSGGGGVRRIEVAAEPASALVGVRLSDRSGIGRLLRHLPLPKVGRIEAFDVVRRAAVDLASGAVSSAGRAESGRPSVGEVYQCAVALAAEAAAREPLGSPPAVPTISIVVPVWNAAPAHLDDLLRSFALQAPGWAELILADDASTDPATRARLGRARDLAGVRLVERAENGGIAAASAEGLTVAHGDWVGFLDHDDALAPGAIDRVVRALRAHPEALFLYTDEMITGPELDIDGVFLKPAWDEVLLSGVNYVNHFSLYRRDRLMEVGGFEAGFDGSQDYDLLLRHTAGLDESRLLHLPYPAYLWRRSPTAFSVRHLERATDAARRALARRFGVSTVEGAISPDLHRLRLDREIEVWPRVSVIVPNRESAPLMRMLIDGLEHTDYPDLEIIVHDNGSESDEIREVYDDLFRRFERVDIDIVPAPFNFARSINRGVARATGDLLLFLNNDIEVIEPGWLKEMVSCFRYARTGVVGAKLLYPDRRIQHAGVIAGLGDLAGHWYWRRGERDPGPMGRLWVRQTFSCVTGACMLVSRACWEAVGRFDEEAFAIAYNDVDFCLRATKAGFRVVWTPFAALIHHESATRGPDTTPANIDRFRREQDNLKRIHHTDRLDDIALNPWSSRRHSEPFPILRDTLPAVRRATAPSAPRTEPPIVAAEPAPFAAAEGEPR